MTTLTCLTCGNTVTIGREALACGHCAGRAHRAVAYDDLSVDVLPDRCRVVVRASGELDLSTAPTLEAAIEELLAVGFDDVVLDLGGVSFIDSTGIRLLVTRAQAAAREHWRLRIEPRSAPVERVIDLVGVRALLDAAARSPVSSGVAMMRVVPTGVT